MKLTCKTTVQSLEILVLLMQFSQGQEISPFKDRS